MCMQYKDKQWLVDNILSGISAKTVGRQCGCDASTVRYWAKKYGISFPRGNRRYAWDDHYFDTIDTETKAYFVGFIAADGWVQRNGRALGIKVTACDTCIIEQLRLAIGGIQCITLHAARETTTKTGVSVRTKEAASMYLSSKHMVATLRKYGIVPHKSRTLTLFNLPESLMRHYLRGLFDGDGHIGKRQYAFTSGSNRMLVDVICFVNNRFGIKPNLTWRGKTGQLQFNRCDHAFIKWMYGDATIALPRKLTAYNNTWHTYTYCPNTKG